MSELKNKRRICVVSYSNLYILPYAKTYIQHILDSGAECTLLYWDREETGGVKEKNSFPSCKHVVFQKYKPVGYGGRIYQLKTYFSAAKFFRKQLRKYHYDGLIFLQTHAAISCFDILHKYYVGKYIVDIRDFTLENVCLFRKIEGRALKEAYKVVISSPAYQQFLPKAEYVVAHNFTEFIDEKVVSIKNKAGVQDKPLVISFVGTVRFYEMDRKLLEMFGNDERYKVCYYGTGSDVLASYCKENGITNVDFSGSFTPDQTLDFYNKTSMINNLYGNHNPYLDYALSNKIYHAVQLYKPILVCPETYMEEIVRKYHLGFVVDLNNGNAPDILWKENEKFDWKLFIDGCNDFIDVVKRDNTIYIELCKSFSSGNF